MNTRKMIILYGVGGVLDITNKSASTIWRWEAMGLFPKRHKIGPNSVVWFSDEIDIWLQNPTSYSDAIKLGGMA